MVANWTHFQAGSPCHPLRLYGRVTERIKQVLDGTGQGPHKQHLLQWSALVLWLLGQSQQLGKFFRMQALVRFAQSVGLVIVGLGWRWKGKGAAESTHC